MRHGKKVMHLGRKTAHRKSMLANMACSLIEHKRINTTVTKAKALKQFIEPIITKSKEDSTHNRRTAFRYLRSKEAVSALFRDVAVKVGDRPGGYTRIIKLGNRLGDNADMAMIELVDFNEIYNNNEGAKKKTTKKSFEESGRSRDGRNRCRSSRGFSSRNRRKVGRIDVNNYNIGQRISSKSLSFFLCFFVKIFLGRI